MDWIILREDSVVEIAEYTSQLFDCVTGHLWMRCQLPMLVLLVVTLLVLTLLGVVRKVGGATQGLGIRQLTVLLVVLLTYLATLTERIGTQPVWVELFDQVPEVLPQRHSHALVC